jgi:hypothetical protein
VRHGTNGTTTARRSLSLLLLAVQFVAFVLGGALLGDAQASAAGRHRASVTLTSVTSGDGPTVASSSASRMERARPRDGGARGAGGPSVAALVTTCAALPHRASHRALSSFALAASRAHRPPPCVVNGPRGPPHAA